MSPSVCCLSVCLVSVVCCLSVCLSVSQFGCVLLLLVLLLLVLQLVYYSLTHPLTHFAFPHTLSLHYTLTTHVCIRWTARRLAGRSVC